VDGAPFKTKSECGKIIGVNRQTVTAYLDTGKILKNNLIFVSFPLSTKELSTYAIPTLVWDAVVGDLLGDGYISRSDNPGTNSRLEFTFSIKNLPYLKYLKYVMYSRICTLSEPTS